MIPSHHYTASEHGSKVGIDARPKVTIQTDNRILDNFLADTIAELIKKHGVLKLDEMLKSL